MIPGKGDITYIYSATGAKLEKRTHILKDSTSHNEEITKATAYISGFIYQDNQLSLFGHEEGRVRVKTTNNSPLIFTFDYFLKDHLGNIRTVLTEEKKQDNYPAATLEDGATPTEKNYYTINDANIVNKSVASVIANYANNKGIANNNPSSNTAGLSDKVYKLKSAGGGKTGLGITLRVMAGDEINIFGKSYRLQQQRS